VHNVHYETIDGFRYRAGYLKVGLKFGLPAGSVPLIQDVTLNQEGWNEQYQQDKYEPALNVPPEASPEFVRLPARHQSPP
jgi:hypothetical protein